MPRLALSADRAAVRLQDARRQPGPLELCGPAATPRANEATAEPSQWAMSPLSFLDVTSRVGSRRSPPASSSKDPPRRAARASRKIASAAAGAPALSPDFKSTGAKPKTQEPEEPPKRKRGRPPKKAKTIETVCPCVCPTCHKAASGRLSNTRCGQASRPRKPCAA